MKRFLVLLLAFGILSVAGPASLLSKDEKKDKEEKKDKKDEKDKDKKDDKDKKEKDKEDKDKDKKDKDKKDKDKKEEKPLTDEQKKELGKLSGTFEVVKFERDGKDKDKDEKAKMKVVQKGADYTFTSGDEPATTGKDTPYPDKDPKEIDSLYLSGTSPNKVVKGIYKIDGDTITYCWADEGKARPKEFATKADSGLTLLVLKRVKEEKKVKDKDKGKDDVEKKDKDKKEKKDKEDKDKKEKKDDKGK